MRRQLFRKDIEGARQHADGSVGMLTGAAARDLLAHAREPGVGGLRVPSSCGNSLNRARECVEAEEARSALAGALAGEVAEDPRRLDDAAASFREDGDHARSERRAERRAGEGQLERVRGQPGAEVAAEE